MCDSGGSTGKLRKELGILPPGDVRRAILALSDLPFARKTLEEVFDFRFEDGRTLAGHSLGNILLAALTQITGSMDRAIEEAARILNASGKIYPITLDKTNLVAILEDGTRVFGEANIDMRNIKPKVPIKKVYLSPSARIFQGAAKALRQADMIVIGPGDLYSSLVPTVLVEGVNRAIKASKAKLVYIVNLMTKRGETDGFKTSDFVRVLENYLCGSAECLNYVVVNKKISGSPKKISAWYRHYGSAVVKDDLSNNKKNSFKVVSGNFVDTTTFYRHNSDKIARKIISLL